MTEENKPETKQEFLRRKLKVYSKFYAEEKVHVMDYNIEVGDRCHVCGELISDYQWDQDRCILVVDFDHKGRHFNIATCKFCAVGCGIKLR